MTVNIMVKDMNNTIMTEKAKTLYNEIDELFQEGDGTLEKDMLFNLFDILKCVDDSFLDLFTYKVNNEFNQEEDIISKLPIYEHPSVTFQMVHNERIFFRVECGGVSCVNPLFLDFDKERSKYPKCFRPKETIGFHFIVNNDNEEEALEFLEFFTKHFIDNPNNG